MSEIKPEELKELHTKREDINANKINYEQITDSSLKNIDEMHKLFPHWKRERVLKKLRDTVRGKDLRFIAIKNGKSIGHVRIMLKKSIHGHVAEVTSLIVDPKERRQGIGIGLMQYSISKLTNKITIITLAVDSKNRPAIALYKKIGFEKYGLLKKASKIDGKFVDNYLMVKYL